MNGTADRNATESWIRRARPLDPARQNGENDSCRSSVQRMGSNNVGWNPSDVWLSLVERSRRQRIRTGAV